MDKLKYNIDCIKRDHKLLGRKNSCDAINEAAITAICIFNQQYLDCTCDLCGVRDECKNRWSKDCRYIHDLRRELNKIKIIL